MKYKVELDGRTVEVDLSGLRPRVDGVEVDAELVRLPGGDLHHLRVDGRGLTLQLRRGSGRGRWEVGLRGRWLDAEAEDERSAAIRAMAGESAVETARTLVAPMPGLVVRVEVEVGQEVRAGQGVVVVEAITIHRLRHMCRRCWKSSMWWTAMGSIARIIRTLISPLTPTLIADSSRCIGTSTIRTTTPFNYE